MSSYIIFTNRLEYKAGSTPESAQPPTPSATIRTWLDAWSASSPPLCYFYGWGNKNVPYLNEYFSFFCVENKKCADSWFILFTHIFQNLIYIIYYGKI
jgi:hypothetical protein